MDNTLSFLCALGCCGSVSALNFMGNILFYLCVLGFCCFLSAFSFLFKMLSFLCCVSVSAFNFMGKVLSFLSVLACCSSVSSFNFMANDFDVFITHRGKDVKETAASLIFHNLQNKGRKVFFDKKSIQVGLCIPECIVQAINKSSVHIAIFSPNFAASEWCLIELYLICKTGAPIIPLFHGVQPRELRMEGENGAYSRAFQIHKRSGKFKSTTLEKWEKALRHVSYTKGIIYEGDEGELLERIATRVSECLERGNSTEK